MTSVTQALHNRIIESIESIRPPELFKIVVLDARTTRIVNSACKMLDIMDKNVTLVETLEKQRQEYISLEAIYLLTPCVESVQRLMDDFPSGKPTGKYKAAHVLFTGPLDDALFKRLTQSAASKYIRALRELFIDFSAVESRVFSFENPQSFFSLYSPAKKSELPDELNSIAKQLMSVIATFGDFPSIRYFRPPETVDGKRTQSMKLAMLLQAELESYMRGNPDSAHRQQGQGTVIVLDRSVDVTAAILHEFTYQAMANDLLPIEDGTKYTYEIENSNNEKESVSVVIDESDQVFMDIRHAHIVETAKTLTAKFNQFVAENEALRGDKDKVASLRNMKDQLANLPQFQDLKAKYSAHIHMTKECMKIFEKFKINELGLVEQQLATGETVEGHLPKQIVSEMLPFLADTKVSTMDKIRLLMLYMICRGGIKREDRELLFDHTKISEGNAEAVMNLGLLGINTERGGKAGPKTRKKGFFPRKKTEEEEQMFDLSRYVTKVKRIVEGQINGTLDSNLYPYTTEAPSETTEADAATKSLRSTAKTTWDKKKPTVKGSRIIVFVAGGVTYSEIRAVHEVCHSLGRDVIVGSTHILTPRQFIHSLRHLAKGPARPPLPIIPPYRSVATPTAVAAATPSSTSSSSARLGSPDNIRPSRAGIQPSRTAPPQIESRQPSSTQSRSQPMAPPLQQLQQQRALTPEYRRDDRSVTPNGGAIRTIQKDASGRFIAPSSPSGQQQQQYYGQPTQQYGGAQIPSRAGSASPNMMRPGAAGDYGLDGKKKNKVFGFI